VSRPRLLRFLLRLIVLSIVNYGLLIGLFTLTWSISFDFVLLYFLYVPIWFPFVLLAVIVVADTTVFLLLFLRHPPTTFSGAMLRGAFAGGASLVIVAVVANVFQPVTMPLHYGSLLGWLDAILGAISGTLFGAGFFALVIGAPLGFVDGLLLHTIRLRDPAGPGAASA
jgi:hypothetical protein